MLLKKQSDWVGPFYSFDNGLNWVVYDSEFNIPIVFGNAEVCKRFLTKYIPATSTIFYFNKKTWKSHHHLSFSWVGTYRGISPAEEAEEKIESKSEKSSVIIPTVCH